MIVFFEELVKIKKKIKNEKKKRASSKGQRSLYGLLS